MGDRDQPVVYPCQAGESADACAVIGALRSSLVQKDDSTKKTPYGLDQALQDSLADTASLAFLKAGPKVWYAYFRAIHHNESNKRLVTLLSEPTLERIVTEASSITAHESVAERIKHIFCDSYRGRKRSRK